MNDITSRQNDEKQLIRLAAQRQLYTEAKRLEAFRTLLAVPLVLVWAGLAAVFPALQPYAAAWGISIALIDIACLSPLERLLQRKAAKVQELFDCDILHMNWRQLRVGRRPDSEDVAEAANKYRRKDPFLSSLVNWYPAQISEVSLPLARLICQRTNCWWDAKLRLRYANNALAIVALLSIVVVLLGLLGNFTMESFVLNILAPLLPAFVWSIRQYSEQREYATVSDRLKQYSEDLWERALATNIPSDELDAQSRELQDEIYDRRCRGPLIFDWIYSLLRREYEEQANVGASAMIEQLKSQNA